MGPHATRLPAIVAALIAVIAVAAAAPAGARAAGGDGPYTPFPDRPGDQARDYVKKLNERGGRSGGARTITPRQLTEGVASPPGEGASLQAGAPARRGGSANRSADRGGGSANRPGGGRRGSGDGSADGVASAASPFGRAGVTPASPPPDPSVVPFLALGGLMALAAGGLGVYRVRRRWAA